MTQKPRQELTDLDLAPMNRTLANYWKAKYFESHKELMNANKGIRRLKRKFGKKQVQIDTLKQVFRYGYATTTHLNIVELLYRLGVPIKEYKEWERM